MTLDKEYYKINMLHKGTKKEKDPSVELPIMHKSFYMQGKVNLDSLEELTKLKKDPWKKLYPILFEHRNGIEETWVYANINATAIISTNYKTDYHEIDITLKNYSDDNPQIIENTKNIIEKNLECKLNEKNNNLTSKLESN